MRPNQYKLYRLRAPPYIANRLRVALLAVAVTHLGACSAGTPQDGSRAAESPSLASCRDEERAKALAEFCALADNLEDTNAHLNALIREIWTQADYSLENLEHSVDSFLLRSSADRAFLAPFSEDRDVLLAFLVNVLTMRDHNRKDGLYPYAIHPGRMAIFLNALASTIPPASLKRAAMLIQVHDIYEEMLHMYAEAEPGNVWLDALANAEATSLPLHRNDFLAGARLRFLRDRTGLAFDQHADDVRHIEDDILMLMAPETPYEQVAQALGLESKRSQTDIGFVAENALLARMVRRRNSLAVVIVELLDRLDYFFDLDYLDTRNAQERSQKIADHLGRSVWTLRYIVNGVPKGTRYLPASVQARDVVEAQPAVDFVLRTLAPLLRDEKIVSTLREGCGTAFPRLVNAAMDQFEAAASQPSTLDEWLNTYVRSVFPELASLDELLATLPPS